MAIYDKGQSTIDIYNLPSTITPVITPSPSWYYNVDGPTYNYDHWRISFDTPNVATTYTISAIGYVSQEVIAGSSDLHTNITLVAETRYMSKFSDGTNTYTVKDTEARTSLSSKQDTLVSGTNIKTINGNSLLGNGDLSIGGSVDIDGETITQNDNNELQAVGVINSNTNSGAIRPLKIWNGTQVQWNHGEATIWNYWQTETQALWNNKTLSNTISAMNIAFGNNTFIIMSYNGNGYSSVDNGETWTTLALPSVFRRAIAFGDGNFVIVRRDSNTSYYSTDNGSSWNSATLPSTTSEGFWNIVCYGNNRFIAATYRDTKTAYSTDGGKTWTAGGNLPSDTSNYWSNMVYDENAERFICTNGTVNAAYSDDGGETWTKMTLPFASYFLAYGNGRLIQNGGSNYNSKNVAYSDNAGETWTINELPLSRKWNDIKYGNGKFVMISWDSNTSCYSTDNGITWNTVNLTSSGYWGALCYGNEKFVAAITGTNTSFCNLLSVSYDKCYTLDQNPTTSSQVYSAPETTSSKTITSVGSGTITLSDNLLYNFTPAGNQNTYRTIGVTHPDWLCNINNVGVKIGNTIIATKGDGSSGSYVAGTGIDITSNEISVTSDISTGAALGATAVQPSALATVATSGSYNDLSNKPTIPTVNNATLTIQKNGTNVATFTANASNNVTANISVPTNTNELTNGAGFITSSALSGYQTTTNLVTSVSSSSTDSQYPSAKLFYDTVGDIETVINTIRGV